MALDIGDAQLALRARLLTLSVATTGTMELAATTAGYTRASGSFIDDDFYEGMEVVPSGFTQTTPGIVSRVEALTLSIAGGRSAEASGAGRSLTVGLPPLRAWENVRFDPADAVGRVWIEENMVPATSNMRTGPYDRGILDEFGLYVINWRGVVGYDVIGIRKCVAAAKALFASGTTFTVGSARLRITGGNDDGPYESQIEPDGEGWAICTLTIPWQAESPNAVAA